MSQQKLLKTNYLTYNSPGAFGGIERLRKTVKNVNFNEIKKWLSYQDTYTLHKPVRYNFPRRRTIVYGLREQFQCDLIDVQRLKNENDNNKYILTCIDVFSKVGYAQPIQNKTSKSVIPAFEIILKSSGIPTKLQTDKGTEFISKETQRYLKQRGIHHFTTQNATTKASVCERWNRTLLSRLNRVFTLNKNRHYIEILPKIVSAYNHSYHRSIKRRPVDVSLENQEDVWHTLYGSPLKHSKPNQLKVNDRVRISKAKQTFRKGYLPSWSGELFTVTKVLRTTPRTFIIQDDNGEQVIGSFYQEELQKVGEKSVYEIERVIRERRSRGGRREVLVKWKDYPDSFNSWILKSTIKTSKPNTSRNGD